MVITLWGFQTKFRQPVETASFDIMLFLYADLSCGIKLRDADCIQLIAYNI